jgi:hypothetical protein
VASIITALATADDKFEMEMAKMIRSQIIVDREARVDARI